MFCPCFILRAQGKYIERKMDPFYEHPIFDKAKEKILSFIRQLEKPQEIFESLLYTCFKCGSKKIFSMTENRLGLLIRERLYSTNVENVTINGGFDDTHYAANLPSKFKQRVYQPY